MKPLFVFLVLAGLALGPGYWVWAKLYSGRLAQTLELRPDPEGRMETPAFRLDADMRPVGLILKAQGGFAPNMPEDRPPRDVYLARVTLDGRMYKEFELPLRVKSVSDSNPAFVERLLWLESVAPGEYRLTLTPKATPDITLDHARLEVRAQVREPDGRLASAGMAMLVLGLLALFLG